METAQLFTFKVFVFILFFAQSTFGQDRLQTIASLSSELQEISGIIKGQDDTYLTINDSGNSNEILVLNEKVSLKFSENIDLLSQKENR